jgi:Pvc16 N-terminal domain
MSNFLAIATVTATLQRLLQASVQLDVPGARVTTVRPDASGGSTPEVGVNVYLYQATPNPAWRNADLRNRRPKGDLIKYAQAGLDLYYLMTFYGNEVELEPQRLLGSTVRTLVDQPILTAEMIQDTIERSNFDFLQRSTLAEQVERVTIVPSFLCVSGGSGAD